MIPVAYRALLRDPRPRRLLAGLGVSSLGDGMSTVTIAWLAVRVAPAGRLGLFVGLAIAAYTLARLTEARKPAADPQTVPLGGHTSYSSLTS